jgi:hypothetical protein
MIIERHIIELIEQKPDGKQIHLEYFDVQLPFEITLAALELNPDDWYVNQLRVTSKQTSIYLVRV